MKKPTLIFRRNLELIKWLVPLGLVLLVIFYEIGPSSWIFERWGFTTHLTIEIILFGTVGPLIAFFLLEMLSRWLDEKDTADLQANLLAEARRKDSEIRQVSDDTLQVLFATSLLMSSIKSARTDLPQATITEIEVTEKALNESILQLNAHLTS